MYIHISARTAPDSRNRRKDSPPDVEGLKAAQLGLRQAEVEETVRVLRNINKGAGGPIYDHNPRREGSDLASWHGRLATDDITVVGHSYGATLALQTLKDAPSKKLPIKGGIILDPGKQSGPSNDIVDVPILVLHSNSWSKKHSVFYSRPHFDVVGDLVQGVLDKGEAAWFMTSSMWMSRLIFPIRHTPVPRLLLFPSHSQRSLTDPSQSIQRIPP